MSSMVVGIGTAVASIGAGIMGSRSAKKEAAKSRELQMRQLALMEQQMANYKKLVNAVPGETREMIESLNKSYSQVSILLDEAKRAGDQNAAAKFELQRQLITSHMDAELTAIGQNADAFTATLDELSTNAVNLLREDQTYNEGLMNEYKAHSDAAIGTLKQMADLSSQRLQTVMETGLTPEAASIISKMQQGITDMSRKTEALEAQMGKGGSASRVTATELEGLKALAETTANLRADARNEIAAASDAQMRFLGAAGEQMQRLERTAGREELAVRQPYEQMKLQGQQLEGEQSLRALGSANVETRRVTGAEGEASLGREAEYARDRMNLVQGQAASTQALKEREQDLKFQGIAGQAKQARSMADIMGVQAQNYANMAQQSRAQSMGLFASAAKGLAGGAIGMGEGGVGFGAGFMQGAFGINPNCFQKPATPTPSATPTAAPVAPSSGPTSYGLGRKLNLNFK